MVPRGSNIAPFWVCPRFCSGTVPKRNYIRASGKLRAGAQRMHCTSETFCVSHSWCVACLGTRIGAGWVYRRGLGVDPQIVRSG